VPLYQGRSSSSAARAIGPNLHAPLLPVLAVAQVHDAALDVLGADFGQLHAAGPEPEREHQRPCPARMAPGGGDEVPDQLLLGQRDRGLSWELADAEAGGRIETDEAPGVAVAEERPEPSEVLDPRAPVLAEARHECRDVVLGRALKRSLDELGEQPEDAVGVSPDGALSDPLTPHPSSPRPAGRENCPTRSGSVGRTWTTARSAVKASCMLCHLLSWLLEW